MSSETVTWSRAASALTGLLPGGWSWRRLTGVPGADSVLLIRAPDGSQAELDAEVKVRLQPGGVPVLEQAARRSARPMLLIAPWLSPATRAALTAAGIHHLDLTGNAEVRLARPGLFIRTDGAARDPKPAPGTLGSLRGAGSARAVRALIDFVPPYGVRALAQASGASAPVLSRVLELLASDGLVDRDSRGAILRVDWEGALRRWAEDYRSPVRDSGGWLDPRGLGALRSKLSRLGDAWAATGTLGVSPDAVVAPLAMATIYVPEPEQAARVLGLVPAEAGVNVVLVAITAADELVRSTSDADDMRRCAPSQVAVDLFTGPGRGSSEAEALLAWMREDERRWRRTF